MKKLKLISFALLICVLSSCSVIMAARKQGTNIETIQTCCTRGQLLSCGALILSSEWQSTGELIEIYQFQKERGSAVRALMHGALDVTTCGLWEVVGTPIEACADQPRFFCIKVYYDEDEYVQKIELM